MRRHRARLGTLQSPGTHLLSLPLSHRRVHEGRERGRGRARLLVDSRSRCPGADPSARKSERGSGLDTFFDGFSCLIGHVALVTKLKIGVIMYAQSGLNALLQFWT